MHYMALNNNPMRFLVNQSKEAFKSFGASSISLSLEACYPFTLDNTPACLFLPSSLKSKIKGCICKANSWRATVGFDENPLQSLGRYYLPHYSTDWPYFIQGLLHILLTADEQLHEYTK